MTMVLCLERSYYLMLNMLNFKQYVGNQIFNNKNSLKILMG